MYSLLSYCNTSISMYVDNSVGSGPVTLDRLKDHYKHCIRLSASNKINAKNAFVLQLIDYMQDLVNQTEDGQMNFKIASSALDVGAKIYSHRVDCVHSEAQKVASSILMAFDGQSKQHQDHSELGDSNNDDTTLNDSKASNEGDESDHRKKKKVSKSIKTIADEKTLNGILEKIVIGDAYLDSLSQEYDLTCPAALICYNSLTQPNCILTIESKYLRKSYTKNEKQIGTNETNEHTIPVSLITKNNNCSKLIQVNKSNKICPRLNGFLFNDRTTTIAGFNQNQDESKSYPQNTGTQISDKLTEKGEHGYDPEIYDNPNDDFCDSNMGDFGDNPGLARNDDDDPIPNLDKIAAMEPQEYGYINEPRLLNTWAGPHAWKAVKLPQTTKKDLVPKSARKRIKLEQRPIDFSEQTNPSLEEFGDKELRHSAETIRKWKKPLLPQDHNLNDDVVRSTVVHTFFRPEDTYHCPRTAAEALLDVNKDHSYSANDGSHSVSPDLNFDNIHDDSDDEFRADPVVNGNEVALYDAPLNSTLTQNADMEFAGENLIEQPFPVTQIHIPFAKVAKKMDIRKLKRVMWELLALTEKVMDVTVQPMNSTEIEGMDKTLEAQQIVPKSTSITPTPSEPSLQLEFSNLYGSLPERVSPKMSHDLSQPIAFVTLLHLANEKNLKLIPRENLRDFVIQQEESI